MRVLIPLVVALLFTSCAYNPLYEKRVAIHIEEQHPWHALSYKPMWKTLRYTDGERIRTVHLSAYTTQAEIVVPRGTLVAICAYPLGDGAPWGGVFSPGNDTRVTLTQKNGALAHLLLQHWRVNPHALAATDSALLAMRIEDARLIDQSILVRSLCEGGEVEVVALDPLIVTLSDLPEGRWISEYLDGTSFYARWGEMQQVPAFDGVQRWLNKERSLCLSLTVDLPSRRSLWALYPAPEW